MQQLNLMEEFHGYFSAQTFPETVEINNQAHFISIHATGSFTDQSFFEKIKALTSVAHALKKTFNDTEKAFEVSVLEALYWYDEDKYGFVAIPDIFSQLPLSKLEYRLMIRIPDYITQQDLASTVKFIGFNDKKLASSIELFERTEGKSVQMLHVGPFQEEKTTLLQLQQYMDNEGLVKAGVHHEIYLVDFLEEPDENKLRTILREQVKIK